MRQTTNFRADLGNRMLAARQRAGLTQIQLAERAGTRQATVSNIERGVARPTIELVERIARACGGSVAELWGEEEISS